MSQLMAAPFKRTKGQTRWVVFMATLGGWLLANLTVLGVLFLSIRIDHEKNSLGASWGIGLDLMTGGLVPWIPFLVIYVPLTQLLKDRVGGWTRTQLIVTLIAWLGGFVVLVVMGQLGIVGWSLNMILNLLTNWF